MKMQVKKFILRTLLVGSPFIIVVVCAVVQFIVTDPYAIFKSYDNPYNQFSYISKNRDYISAEAFDANHIKEEYNSFIFGNSRSIFYPVEYWQKYLDSDSHPFHFDASGDDVLGIVNKLKYIDKQGSKINNVMIVIDHQSFGMVLKKGAPLFNRPWQVDTTSSKFEFYQEMLLTYVVNIRLLFGQLDYMLFGLERDWGLFNFTPISYSRISNQISYDNTENLIETSPQLYYTAKRMAVFYPRDTTIITFAPSVIKNSQKELLYDIKMIFDKHKTNYKIIISPLYDQKKLSLADKQIIDYIFGQNNVFDFSGINSFTKDYHNYYEDSHYRPHVAKAIIDTIYSTKIN